MIKSTYEECKGSTVSMYQEEQAQLVKRMMFECKHGISRTSLVARCRRALKEIAVPRPGIARLSLEKRIVIKYLQSQDKQSFHKDKLAGIRHQDSRNRSKIS